MSKKIADALNSVAIPMILSIREEGNDKVTIRSYVDTSGKEQINIMTNGEEPLSPISGKKLKAYNYGEGEMEEASSTVSEILVDNPVVGNCTHCENDIVMSHELATELDGTEIHCLACSNDSVAINYYGDLVEAMDDDMSDEDMDDDYDDEDMPEDEDDEDMPEDDDSEDEDDEDDMSEDEDDDMGDDEDKEDVSEDASGDEEDHVVDGEPDEEPAAAPVEDKTQSSDTPKEDPAEVSAKLKIYGMSTANLDESLRMVAVDQSLSRLEVFIGDTHVGRLNKEECSASVQELFNRPTALRSAFSLKLIGAQSELASNQEGEKSEELKDFGFTPATTEIEVTEAIDALNDGVTEQVEEQVEKRVEEEVASIEKAFSIALAGVNKGVLDGPNFLSEVATTLKTHGVKNHHSVARKLMERVSEPFIKSVLEQANILRNEGLDYTRGISQSIESASFVHSDADIDEEDFNEVALTAAASSFGSSNRQLSAIPKPSNQGKQEVASTPVSYKNIFSKMGR